MSQSRARHAAPSPNRNIKAIRTVRFWAAPIVITLALMSALAALYLGGILNPTTSLRHFPIAVVNEDSGTAGGEIVDSLLAKADKNKYDFRVVSHDEAKQLLDRAQAYGELLIPPTFSSNLNDFGASAVLPGHADRPSVTILTNPAGGHPDIEHRQCDADPGDDHGQSGSGPKAYAGSRRAIRWGGAE